MADVSLKTRIKQKTDTSANWAKATNFVPLKGEIIVYNDLNRIKIGDGVTKVSALPFLADSDTHQSIKTLNTNNTTAQTVSANEAIAGSGTINLHKVAKTGSYNDLNNKPTIPTVNNGQLTIQKNGTAVATFTANQSGNATANISVPTKLADLSERTFSDITSRGEAFLSWGGQNLSGSYGPIDACMVPDLGANRFAFIPASAWKIEYSRDSGATWTDYGASDGQKLALTSEGATLSIGKADNSNKATAAYMLRITLTTTNVVYTTLNKFLLYVSTNGSSGSYVTIQGRTKANLDASKDTWAEFVSKAPISGWSGWNVINTSGITTHGNRADQYAQLRFIFGCTSGSTTYSGLQIQKLFAYGGVGWATSSNMAKNGHMYKYDYNQNVKFPKKLYVNESKEVLAAGQTNTFTGTSAFNSGIIHLGQGDNNALDLGNNGRLNSGNQTLVGMMSGAFTLGHSNFNTNIRGKTVTVNGSALLKLGSQTTTSTTDGGSNIYTFTDTNGATSTFTVKNGSTGSVANVVNSGSGNVVTDISLDKTTKVLTVAKATQSITEPNNGKGHSHGYDKVTSATFNGAGGTTGGSGTGITAALSNAPTFTGNAHSHSVSEPNEGKGHVHGYDKVTSIWPNNSDKSSGGATTGITASSSQPGFSGSAHSHSITEPNSGTGHSHGYDKVTNIWADTTAATTGGSGTGITAFSSAPGFTGSSHSHTASDSGHAHGYTRVGSASCAGWNISVDGTTLIFAANTGVTLNNISDTTGSGNASISVSSTTAGGSVSAPTITINDPGHTHSYTAPTGGCGWIYNEGKTTQTSTSASTTGISINSTTAGGSVSTPVITINDPGHSHTYNHTDSIGWNYNDGKDTQATTSYSTTGIGINSTTATGSVSKPDVKITDTGHSHSFTPSGSVGLTYNSGTTTQAQTAQSTTGISINNATAGGSVSKSGITINDPGHTHVEQ